MAAESHPNRRMLVSVDMERYSQQDNDSQLRSQRLFQQVMRQAAAELGIDRSNWTTQLGGDGELAVLPSDTPERHVVSELVFALDRLLAKANRRLAREARVRLRVAIHEGLVHLDGAAGFPGDAVVTVCRLVDAAQLKAALRAFPVANVALIVSGEIYRGVVCPYRKPRPERFRKIDVRMPEKGFDSEAWIFVPDEDVNRLETESRTSEPESLAGPASQPPPTQRFDIGPVRAKNAAFGNNNTLT